MVKGIPGRWRELSGLNKWHGLLNPLDSDLQRYIIHYGSMAQATYDTFNHERLSRYTGSSKYSIKDLFREVGLVKGNPFQYTATKYIYATSHISLPNGYLVKSLSDKPWLKESNWTGFVAVANDKGKAALGRRDILVAWRGTILPVEWIKDFDFPLTSADKITGPAGRGANLHEGFLSMYTSSNPLSLFNKTSAREQVISEVKRLVEKHKNEDISITVTGHSLGASLSMVNAADIACNGFNKSTNQPNKPCPVTAFNFASPKVGDMKFKKICDSMNDLRVLSIQNATDIVPILPPFIGYYDVGVELKVDSTKSPFLTESGNPANRHNLEGAYLHAIALGKGNIVCRDIALANKDISALKEKYQIPSRWWCQRNKGMVQQRDGCWKLQDHEGEKDDP